MLVVETIAKMRRLSLVQGKSIKQICREPKVSRLQPDVVGIFTEDRVEDERADAERMFSIPA